MNKFLVFAALTACSANLQIVAKKILLSEVDYRGPIEMTAPLMIDSIDINNKKFDVESFLSLPFGTANIPVTKGDSVMVLGDKNMQLHFITIPIINSKFADLEIEIDGIKNYKLYLDGKETQRNMKLKPGSREIMVKLLTLPDESDTVRFSISSSKPEYVSNREFKGHRNFTLEDVIYAKHFRNVETSPSGKYAILSSSVTLPDNRTVNSKKIVDLKDGRSLGALTGRGGWLEDFDLLWGVRTETDGSLTLISTDPVSWKETEIAKNIPEGDFVLSPDCSFLIYNKMTTGPAEDEDIYRVVNPEDRQPGWRDRNNLAVYEISTGSYKPLTFGRRNVYLQDISPDKKRILLMVADSQMGKRPTTVFSLYDYDLATRKIDTIAVKDGFITGAKYSPDATKLVITGSPEAFGGIGKNVPEDRIPSMIEGEFFILNLKNRDLRAATKFFNPSVQNVSWNKADGKIYFSAENKDRISLFSYDPTTDRFSDLNSPEDIVIRFSLAEFGKGGALIGESASNPDNFYAIDFKNGKPFYRKLDESGRSMLSEVTLAEVVDYDFVNSVGDTINGRLYFPPDFDPDRKYPLIVNYYGGCSPTGRNFATRYPHHLYANQGYIVYVVNPSGATGFGQEFASRHVNTAGEGVARDIIEGITKLVNEKDYIAKDKIGCIGASYGGFMTQYLQTVTDLFAAAISHAGISDHTSYWGNGYWGYSYSEVSMADSYPWSDPELYVNQSPLYNADKINTPILFLHGDEDTNVPPGESIQLFTALKLLGKDTALVEVSGENHHIMDIEKRKKWQDTIFAWFAKYLQDDSSWWDSLYPPIPE